MNTFIFNLIRRHINHKTLLYGTSEPQDTAMLSKKPRRETDDVDEVGSDIPNRVVVEEESILDRRLAMYLYD